MGLCRPDRGRQAFFVKKLQTGPRSARRGGSAAGEGGVAPQRATGGTVAPPRATGSPPLYKPPTPIPSSFEPKNSTKIQKRKEELPPKILKKKRGVRRREAAKPCRITHL